MEIRISGVINKKLLSKHEVTEAEVRQCFENRDGKLLLDPREKHKTNPPTQWFISYTNKQRRLKIVFVLKEGVVYLKTAYEPNQIEIDIYNQHGERSDGDVE